MKIIRVIVLFILITLNSFYGLSNLDALAMQSGSVSQNSTNSTSEAKTQHRHSKLKKFALIAGIGAVTGGIGGIISGSGVMHGAVMGAGSHVAFHEAKEKYKKDKSKKAEVQTKTSADQASSK